MKVTPPDEQGEGYKGTPTANAPASSPRAELLCLVESYISKMSEAMKSLPLSDIARAAEELLRARAEGKTVYVLGNGGSAATASHAATNWRKPHQYREEDGLRAVSLVDNVALLTAWANDTSFNNVFAAQLSSVLVPGDVVVAISVSGNSPNVLQAVETAHHAGAVTIGFSGFAGGKLSEIVDVSVNVGCDSQETIEDVHMMLVHALSMALKTTGKDCEQGP